jgi:hypothetical protein
MESLPVDSEDLEVKAMLYPINYEAIAQVLIVDGIKHRFYFKIFAVYGQGLHCYLPR